MLENEKKMLNNIIKDLADNFKTGDEQILKELLEDVIINAFFISRRRNTRENLQLLSLEIKNCVKSLYLQRGAEDAKNLNESGKNISFKDPIDEMRKAIIKNGKRNVF